MKHTHTFTKWCQRLYCNALGLSCYALALSLVILLSQSFVNKVFANENAAEQGPHTQKQYHFVSVENSSVQTIGKIVFQQICYKTQLNCYVDMLPAPRAERRMLDAATSGEVMRVWSYGVDNPQFLRVPTPYYHIQTAMIVRGDSGYNITRVEELAPLTIGALQGVKHSQQFALMGAELIYASTTEQLLRLLTKGRIDVAITTYTDGLAVMMRMQADHLAMLPTILSQHPTYVYIHPNYAHLVPIFDDAIKALIDSGEINTMTAQAEEMIFSEMR
ncbi:substrate-binding periplasmic protein [Shewanella aestuarii]|uniref:Amino acid ABC transporter substrate-binding protein n=1 Tax=Shewanella aestuarii TaxID=1028752 RepID=A0A6G9QK10_9GAMM|nr:transporter substrate-binding domain-containing protein [Shewanella aestuarii]QIR14904.1 amino acid ABC transporter substrate-binding protein [Shewanella aestuarii]